MCWCAIGDLVCVQVFTNKKALLQPQEEMERHLTDLIKVRRFSRLEAGQNADASLAANCLR